VTDHIHPEALARELKATSQQVRVATYRAINKTLRSMRSAIAKEVGSDVDVAQKYIKQRMEEDRASLRKMRGRLEERVDAMPAILFNSRQTPSGVRAGKYYFPSAFHAAMTERKGVRVFKRKTKERFPIKQQKVEIEGASQEAFSRVSSRVYDIFKKNFDHELRYLMGLLG